MKTEKIVLTPKIKIPFCGCPDDGYIMYVMGIKKCIRCGQKEKKSKC